jgi:hypothetical protein
MVPFQRIILSEAMIKKYPRAWFLFSVASSLKNEIEATSFHAGGSTSIVSLLCGKLVKK